MKDPQSLEAKNRRTGLTLFVLFLVATALAAIFVVLRKAGYL